jgi:hypothetical protein
MALVAPVPVEADADAELIDPLLCNSFWSSP